MTNYSNYNIDQDELDLISDFKKSLEQIFFTDTKVVVSPSNDDLISLVIEIDSNFSLAEIISLLKMPLDNTFRITDLNKSIFRFKNAVFTLNQSLHTIFDIDELSIYFRDTAITINTINRGSIMEEIDYIIHAIIRHYEYFSTLIGAVPNAIHIPVFEDPSSKGLFNKENSVLPPTYISPYTQFWGFYYDFFR